MGGWLSSLFGKKPVPATAAADAPRQLSFHDTPGMRETRRRMNEEEAGLRGLSDQAFESEIQAAIADGYCLIRAMAWRQRLAAANPHLEFLRLCRHDAHSPGEMGLGFWRSYQAEKLLRLRRPSPGLVDLLRLYARIGELSMTIVRAASDRTRLPTLAEIEDPHYVDKSMAAETRTGSVSYYRFHLGAVANAFGIDIPERADAEAVWAEWRKKGIEGH